MMAWSERVCRTCLRFDNLAPIYPRSDQHQYYTLALFLTTGLQVEMDDGLPQTICIECINFINSAIDFRNKSHKSERKLIQRGHKRKSEAKEKPRSRSSEQIIMQNVNTKLEIEIELKGESQSTDFEEFDEVGCVGGIKEEVKDINAFDWNRKNCESDEEESKNIKIDCESSDTLPEFSEKSKNKSIDCESDKKSKKIKIDFNKRYSSLTDRPLRRPGPYKCKACKKILKNWSTFKNHTKIHRGFDYMCELCGLKFIRISNLLRHCTARHGKEKAHPCPMCDYRALDSGVLKIHVRKAHTGDRPYVCDACGASFLSRRGLIHHLDVHRTERTVQCTLCLAKFKSVQHLACHKSTVHRPFRLRAQCYLCESSYSKLELVRKHLIKVHGVPRQHQEVIRRVTLPTDETDFMRDHTDSP